MIVDYDKNPKQKEFINTTLLASTGLNDFRYICYGGGIRGGKTFAMLGAFIILCRKYPGSKWVIYRKDFPALLDTTIPSIEKILQANSSWKWRRDRSNYYVEYKNGSKIYFYGENIDRDPNLDSMLGLECNGIGLEQVEELSYKLFQMAQSRVGSWYIETMPKPLILMTLNPTQKWPKEKLYLKHRKGDLKPPFVFIEALPSDNPYVTEEQWKAWNNLADRYKKQFIEGDWSNFDIDNPWAFAFDQNKHVAPVDLQPDKNHILYLSFDFNRNPICCSVIQHIGAQIRVIETVKLKNSDIYALCAYIRVNYPNYLYMVTGDATGKNSTALVRDNLNFYKVILAQLGLLPTQLKVPSVNPSIEENQVLVNSLLQNYSVQISPEKGKGLIFDLIHVNVTPDGKIDKENRSDETQQADALDTFRYYCNMFHSTFLKNKH